MRKIDKEWCSSSYIVFYEIKLKIPVKANINADC